MGEIEIKARKVVVHIDCDGEKSWVISLGEVWPTQNLDKCVDWITRAAPEDEVPSIDWIIEVFPGTKRDDGNPDPDIKSLAQLVGPLK